MESIHQARSGKVRGLMKKLQIRNEHAHDSNDKSSHTYHLHENGRAKSFNSGFILGKSGLIFGFHSFRLCLHNFFERFKFTSQVVVIRVCLRP